MHRFYSFEIEQERFFFLTNGHCPLDKQTFERCVYKSFHLNSYKSRLENCVGLDELMIVIVYFTDRHF